MTSFFPHVSNIQQEPKHTTCSNLEISHFLSNSNKSSFLSVCSLLFSVSVPNNYTPVWGNSFWSSCLVAVSSSLQYLHLCNEVSRGWWIQLHCPLRALVLLSILTLNWRANPLIAGQNTNRAAQLQLQYAAGSLCCFQESPSIIELRRSHRTSKGKPEDIFYIKYDPVSPKFLFCTMQ